MPYRLPMFPLGSVIFPYSGVPLQVFEPRYLDLLDTVETGDGIFGSVLIERGFEVGGGDARLDVGTKVRVIGETVLESGMKAIVVAGSERIRIHEWLDDDPHPWAMVETLPETLGLIDVSDLIAAVSARLETIVALSSELGFETADIDLSVADDPVTASFQLAALSPVTPYDSYAMLIAATVDQRLALNLELLGDRIEILRAELGGDFA